MLRDDKGPGGLLFLPGLLSLPVTPTDDGTDTGIADYLGRARLQNHIVCVARWRKGACLCLT
ncbi:MAG: hypothetical protein R6V59_03490 [Dehalococcoidia bacterium]